MKSILIIGAGYLQSFVIKKAKELGYCALVIDKNPNSIGFQYADKFDVIDIIDQTACLNFARKQNINGVLTAATDYGVLSAAYVAKEMNLPGLNYEVAKLIKNKYSIRRKLNFVNNDNELQFFEISDLKVLSEMKEKIRFPVMVKPCDGSGSKATNRANNYYELVQACDIAIKSSIISKALIETYFEGKEYGAESFVYKGNVHVLGIMGKQMTIPPDYAELGHFLPSKLPNEHLVKDVVSETIKLLRINYGAVNMDLIISEDGRINIVDIGARMGGNLIGSHIIPIGTGHDYMSYLIKTAVGDQIEMNQSGKQSFISTRLLALDPGEILSLPDFDEIENKYNVEIFHHLQVGGTIRKYHNNLDGCGYVVATAGNFDSAEVAVENAKNMINSSIVRK